MAREAAPNNSRRKRRTIIIVALTAALLTAALFIPLPTAGSSSQCSINPLSEGQECLDSFNIEVRPIDFIIAFFMPK